MDDFIRQPKRPKISLDKTPEPTETAPNQEVVEVQAEIPSTPENNPDTQEIPPEDMPVKKKRFSFRVPTPKTKKQWIIAGVIMAVLLAGAGFAIYNFILKDNSPAPIVSQEPEPEPELPPEPIYSRVSGRELASADINNRPIYAVQIENSPEARPQSGLDDADIIYEAIAEGGITRFNAVYHDKIPQNIGPIRSLRPYYIDWFLPYDAAIVHAGGSPQALSDVRSLGLKDLDDGCPTRGGEFMRRITEKWAPHNCYSTGQQILDTMTRRGYKSTFTSGLSRTDGVALATPTATKINLNVSSQLYSVEYRYNSATNTYDRVMGGKAHSDPENKKQLSPDVVVVPIVGKSIHPNRVHTVYNTIGSGKVYVFQNGGAVEGTWSKQSRSSQWELKDADGNIIELNRGQTWFTIVESAGRVSFTP